MTDIGFAETKRRVLALHRDGDYAAAMGVARSAIGEFPDHADQTTYWIACLRALLGDRDQALRTLEEGSERGLWWPLEMLEGDPDLTDLRPDERFHAIVAGSQRARASAIVRLPTDPIIRSPLEAPAQAVLLLLHGRSEAAEDVMERWTATHTAFVVAPRSTQPFGMRAVCWDDPQRAEADVQHAMEAAMRQAPIADLPVVTAGFSQGGALAMLLAAKRRLPSIAGFVAVAPSAGWARELVGPDALSADGLRGHLITGELDPRLDDCQWLAQRFRDGGAEIRVEVIDSLGHDYPPDFDERLPRAMSWVLSGVA